jgi:hypothetical protein
MGQVRGLANHVVQCCGCPLTLYVITALTVAGLVYMESNGEVGDKDDGSNGGAEQASRPCGDEGKPYTYKLLQQCIRLDCPCHSLL